MKASLIILLLTLFATPLTYAAKPHATAPAVTLVPGQPVKAVWPGGYEAELRFTRSDLFEVTFNLQSTANTCVNKTGNTVKLKSSYRSVILGWYWTRHPTPARIGKVLYAEYSNGVVDVLEDVDAITSATGTRFPDLMTGIPYDSLSFADTDWLPGMSGGTLAPFTIDSWQSENMITNSQTGITENRITGSAYGLQFQPGADPLTGDIVHIDSALGEYGFGLANALYGTTISWIFNRTSGSCEIDFKMTFVNTPSPGAAPAPARLAAQGPYLWKQDSLIDLFGQDLVGKRLRNVDLQ